MGELDEEPSGDQYNNSALAAIKESQKRLNKDAGGNDDENYEDDQLD